MLVETLLIALGIAMLLVAALVVSAPLIAIALWRARSTGKPPLTFAYVFANGALSSVALGIVGLAWSFGVESEDAGSILSFLVGAGCIGGALAGAVVTTAIVGLGGRAITRRASARSS